MPKIKRMRAGVIDAGPRVLRGVTAAARRLGCNQGHLSRVMRGERKAGRRLAEKMRRLGLVPGSAA